MKWCKTHLRDILIQADTKTVFDFGKTCFLIADDVIGHTQFRLVLNVWR